MLFLREGFVFSANAHDYDIKHLGFITNVRLNRRRSVLRSEDHFYMDSRTKDQVMPLNVFVCSMQPDLCIIYLHAASSLIFNKLKRFPFHFWKIYASGTLGLTTCQTTDASREKHISKSSLSPSLLSIALTLDLCSQAPAYASKTYLIESCRTHQF